jgi:hypothetical protein
VPFDRAVHLPPDAPRVPVAPGEPLAGFAQASIGTGPDGETVIDAAPALAVELFGDSPGRAVALRIRVPGPAAE